MRVRVGVSVTVVAVAAGSEGLMANHLGYVCVSVCVCVGGGRCPRGRIEGVSPSNVDTRSPVPTLILFCLAFFLREFS